jgi:hypothetical protein
MGRINRHNCVYYARENPHITMEKNFNTPGINAWIGIWSGGIIGPYFIEEWVLIYLHYFGPNKNEFSGLV